MHVRGSRGRGLAAAEVEASLLQEAIEGTLNCHDCIDKSAARSPVFGAGDDSCIYLWNEVSSTLFTLLHGGGET